MIISLTYFFLTFHTPDNRSVQTLSVHNMNIRDLDYLPHVAE